MDSFVRYEILVLQPGSKDPFYPVVVLAFYYSLFFHSLIHSFIQQRMFIMLPDSVRGTEDMAGEKTR